MTPYLQFDPTFDQLEAPTGVAHGKVIHPPSQNRIDAFHHPTHGLRTIPPEHLLERTHERRSLLQLGRVLRPPSAVHTEHSAEVKPEESKALPLGEVDDAALLFAAVANRNPYQRDALNNLAASYIQAGANDKVKPVVDKLVELDPSNPDNWLLYAFNYVGLLKTTKDVKLKKEYNDSLVFYNNKSEKMLVKVGFTEFTRNSEGTVLAGTIENRATTPKTYSLVVEFLGSKGEVVDTQTASVGPVAPKGTQSFKIKSAKTGVAGYRYKPLV